jgi:hypothetical protein
LPKVITDKIVVVYTRVDCKGFLEFDTANIEKVIGRAIPQEHEFCFDNPYACVELLKKNAARTGKPMDPKSLKVLKKKFAHSMDEFEELLSHMRKFPRVDIKYFRELFQAKENIEEEVVTLQKLLKVNAEKQANVTRALQDISTAAEWKKEMAQYEKHEATEDWIKVPNESGTHNMVCNICGQTCHQNCQIPFEEHIKRFKNCECFSSKTDKKLKISTESEKQAVLAKVRTVTGPSADIETKKVSNGNAQWLAVKDNCYLCGVHVMGDPAGDDYGAWEEWIQDITFAHEARTTEGTTMSDVRTGNEIVLRDYSNLMKGSSAECRTCGHELRGHGHQRFSWQKKIGTRAVINHEMKGKYDKYASEEQQKRQVLSILQVEMGRLKSEEDSCKHKLCQAMHTFKEKSTATSYVRVLRTQIEYLDYCKDVVQSDPTINSGTRDTHLASIADQRQMLQSGLDVLGAFEVGSPKNKPHKKTQRCISCKGSGTSFMGMRTCGTCKGSGQVAKTTSAGA